MIFFFVDPTVPRPAMNSYPRSQGVETRWIQPGKRAFNKSSDPPPQKKNKKYEKYKSPFLMRESFFTQM